MKALHYNPQFEIAFNYLIDLYNDNPADTSFINEIIFFAEKINKAKKYHKIASLLEEIKDYRLALKYYIVEHDVEPCNANKIDMIRMLLKLEDFDKAKTKLDGIDIGTLNEDEYGEYLYLKSQFAYNIDDKEKAGIFINALLDSIEYNPEYYLLGAKIFESVEKIDESISLLNKALDLKKELPQAYFEKAKIYYKQKKLVEAQNALIKTLYYDNKNSLAFIMLQAINKNKWLPIEKISFSPDINVLSKSITDTLSIIKGDTVNIKLKIKDTNGSILNDVGIIEPYGFGINCRIDEVNLSNETGSATERNVNIYLEARRTSNVNLGKPWLVNVIFFNLDEGKYFDFSIKINVKDNPFKEGRILFVITEDNEQNGDSFHDDNTPDIRDIDAYELRVDLIEKLNFADQLADKYGIKWSHIIDIGSTFLRLEWLKNMNIDTEWNTVIKDRQSVINKSVLSGHDIQLHIHAYNIPGNELFRQYFNHEKNKIEFAAKTKSDKKYKNTNGAWASNYRKIGSNFDKNSRIGSLFHGITILEKELHKIDPSYRTIFFRAGEYEFGKNNEMQKSIIALRKNKILSDSDAFTGINLNRNFKFFRRMGDNVYFSKFNSINEKSNDLLDIGLLEIVPVPKKNGHDYIMPIDVWDHVKYNYDLCFNGDKVKNNIFIIMEMYHLVNINWTHKWDELDTTQGDWLKMNIHFDNIKKNLKRMEFVTISEATKIFLDDYTPDIITMRVNEKELSDKIFLYDLIFLGKDIQVNNENSHFTSIKPPSYLIDDIKKIELLHYDKIVQCWNSIKSYRDLDFQITDKKGYQIKVFLN